MKFLLVFFGSGLGGLTRYIISLILNSLSYSSLISVFFSNTIACLFVGFIYFIISKNIVEMEIINLLFIVGFAGGLSTFSSFGLDNMKLSFQNNFSLAIIYIFITNIICIGFVFLGFYLAKKFL